LPACADAPRAGCATRGTKQVVKKLVDEGFLYTPETGTKPTWKYQLTGAHARAHTAPERPAHDARPA
jgi:hypothetical protein